MEDNYRKLLLEKHPYLSYVTYGGNEYIGVIQNIDDDVTSIYDFGALSSSDLKCQYLELAETWWWESNRMIPINVFLKQDWAQFRPTLKTFISKDVEILCGPHVSLKEIAAKRTKRRSITLVRRPG